MAWRNEIVELLRRGLASGPRGVGAVFALLLGLSLTLLASAVPGLLGLEQWTSDLRTAILSDQAERQHAGVAVLAITEDTLAGLPYREPVDRQLLARLVTIADRAGARAIGLDVILDQPTEPAKDEELLIAIRQSRAPVVLGVADERVPLSDVQQAYQRAFVAEAGRPAGYLNLSIDGDDIVRRSAGPAPGSRWQTSFAGQLAEQVGRPAHGPGRIAWLKPPPNGSSTFAVLPAQMLIREAEAGAVEGAPTLAGRLKDRVVLIGGLLRDRDHHRTPLSMENGETTPGLLLHAQMVAERLDGRRVYDTAGPAMLLLVAIVSFAAFVLGWRYRLRRFSYAVTVIAAAGLLLLDLLAFREWRLNFPFGTLLLATLLSVTAGHVLELLSRSLHSEELEEDEPARTLPGGRRLRFPLLGTRPR